MSKDNEVTVPPEIRAAWNEAVHCAELIRQQKARIVLRIKKDGSTVRYTKEFLRSGRR